METTKLSPRFIQDHKRRRKSCGKPLPSTVAASQLRWLRWEGGIKQGDSPYGTQDRRMLWPLRKRLLSVFLFGRTAMPVCVQ
jgi:hypothetical protein